MPRLDTTTHAFTPSSNSDIAITLIFIIEMTKRVPERLNSLLFKVMYKERDYSSSASFEK